MDAGVWVCTTTDGVCCACARMYVRFVCLVLCVRACVQAAGGMNVGADRLAGVHIGSHVPAKTQRHAEQASYCCGY